MIENRKQILLIHGHHVKPPLEQLESIWVDALRWGLNRDFPDKTGDFENADWHMAYYGDLSNQFLADKKAYDPQLDVADRLHAFEQLKTFNKRKKFNRADYQRLPGKTALKEMLADVGSPLLGKLGLEIPTIARLAPELCEYWDAGSAYSVAVRDRVRSVISRALANDSETLILAHCMGAVISYDILWELSQASAEKKVNMLVTMGCPLGNTTIQKKLAGSAEKGSKRFPANVLAWRNLSAEDDYVCHDKTIADDFRAMLKHRMISSIKDYRIYNMSVRYGKSNPHSSIGYLIHPRVAKILSDWL
ncbi:MAG: hypothetical protein KJO35_08675 [Gammaproteobacteria bacterium]|nr:hypothetical protein [Gammaproteobacteria bacterium]NNF66490.1 hypothetical protein [Gammaproteobacteria bacterium]